MHFKTVILRILLFVLIAVLLIPLFNRVQVFTIRGPNEESLQYFNMVKPGDVVILRFIHSYEKGWVEETYRVDENNYIYPVAHRFQVFNYDMREATYPGDFKIADDGYAYVTNIDKYIKVPIRNWSIRVAYTVPQMLFVRGDKISLKDLLPPGTRVTLNIERWPRYRLMYKQIKGVFW